MASKIGTSAGDSLIGGAAADEISGLGGNDTLVGLGGADYLDGGAGFDLMDGGAGNDTYIVNSTADFVIEAANNGIDEVFSSVSIFHLLDANVENLTLTGAADITGLGNSLANRITGNNGDNRLSGYEGADTLYGGKGNDTVAGGIHHDLMYGGAGDDWLPTDTGNDTVYGGAGGDSFDGYLGNDSLDGGAGNDSMHGGDGQDTLIGGIGEDTLEGGNGDDTLDGGAGNDNMDGGDGQDTLIGGIGADTLGGGFGDDTYVITDLNDVIIDAGGNDTAIVSVSGFRLSPDIENVSYVDGAKPLPYYIDSLYSGYRCGLFGNPIELTFGFLSEAGPDATQHSSTGFRPLNNFEKNIVWDAIESWASVSGIAFTEVLTPVTADEADLCFGMNNQPSTAGYAAYPPGGEIYFDIGQTYALGLLMTILHEIGHALGLKHPHEAPVLPNAEDNLQHTVMSYNFGGKYSYVPEVGDSIDVLPDAPGLYDIATIQYLYGANTATGAGNDTYSFEFYEPFYRTIWDSSGIDTISVANFTDGCEIDLRQGHFSSITAPYYQPGYVTSERYDGVDNLSIAYGAVIENATGGLGADLLTGNEVANRLDGRAGKDTLVGSDGNDMLTGGSGNDRLSGGEGADRFIFAKALNATTNVDRITDFNPISDTIRLDDDIFVGLAIGTLTADAFHSAPGAAAAADANDRVIYDSTLGKLYYDADGTADGSSAVLFATLADAPAVTNSDFLIVA